MGVPSVKELMNPVLEAVRQAGGSAHIDEITESVIRDLGLSEDDANQPHVSNGYLTALEYNLGWARTNLKQSGLITNSKRGIWSLTPDGQGTGNIDPRKCIAPTGKQSVSGGSQANVWIRTFRMTAK